MRLRFLLTTAAATAALASFGMVPMPIAHASLADKMCFGNEPTVVGTSGDDYIHVSAHEGDESITVNDKTWRTGFGFPHPVIIVAGHGNDRISFDSDGGRWAVICSGSGNDALTVTMTEKVSTGPGKDRVTMYLQCEAKPVIYGAEKVAITGFDSVEERLCS